MKKSTKRRAPATATRTGAARDRRREPASPAAPAPSVVPPSGVRVAEPAPVPPPPWGPEFRSLRDCIHDLGVTAQRNADVDADEERSAAFDAASKLTGEAIFWLKSVEESLNEWKKHVGLAPSAPPSMPPPSGVRPSKTAVVDARAPGLVVHFDNAVRAL